MAYLFLTVLFIAWEFEDDIRAFLRAKTQNTLDDTYFAWNDAAATRPAPSSAVEVEFSNGGREERLITQHFVRFKYDVEKWRYARKEVRGYDTRP